MPVNVNVPLAWTKASADEVKFLQNLQCNILKSHGRPFTANIFFKFDPARPALGRRLLRELGDFHVTSALRQLRDTAALKETGEGGGAIVHLALSAKGYAALGLLDKAPTDADFRLGMKAPESLAALSDPPVAAWEAPFRDDLHGVLIVGAPGEGEMGSRTRELVDLVGQAGGQVIVVQHGRALHNAAGDGIEHFGYVDGRSQPLLLQEDIDAEDKREGSSRWDPRFPLSTAVIKDPGTPDPNSFGSLFVFRKLEQDVRGFKTREQQVASALGLVGDDRERAGALLVGRFEDGTPVTMSDRARGEPPRNNFDYTSDPGARCPFHAHIRKTNPRGAGGAEPEAAERGHLMVRRGIPYEDVRRSVPPDELPEVDTLPAFTARVAPLLPTGGVGLLFMAYNRSIAGQFKFTQQTWANNTGFPLPGSHGIDPVIGQGPAAPGDQKLPKQWDNLAAGVDATTSFSGFVKMKGGEYFFSPSLMFLQTL